MTFNQKVQIKDFIQTHLNIQELLKQLKSYKSKRKQLELKLYAEFKKENIATFDIGKFRLYIYDTPEPRIMIYHTKTN
jgi:hypothetical protein